MTLEHTGWLIAAIFIVLWLVERHQSNKWYELSQFWSNAAWKEFHKQDQLLREKIADLKKRETQTDRPND